jgi:hypothetical protein
MARAHPSRRTDPDRVDAEMNTIPTEPPQDMHR